MVEALFAGQAFEEPLDPQSEGLEIGQTAPDFTLNNLEGQPVSLSDYRGKLVLMNMWATWCGRTRCAPTTYHSLRTTHTFLNAL